jgi:hypothetical protein
VELGPGDSLKVDHVVLLSDGSHSMTEDDLVGQERLLAESFVSGMPEGSYTARGILFGGNTRKATAGGAFDRNALGNWASSVRYLAPRSGRRDRGSKDARGTPPSSSSRTASPPGVTRTR